METRFISFEHTRLAVHVAGRGPLAILVHGYPLDHRMWLDVMNGPLAEQRTLAAIDLRGHGESPWCGDTIHGMELFADDVAVVIHTLSDEPVDVVGLSMGGYVLQSLWANHKALVRSLAFVDTRATAEDAAGKAGRDTAMQTVVRRGRGVIATNMLDRLLAPRAESDPLSLTLRARVQTMAESLPVETIIADLRGLRDRPDRTGLLASIKVPTLVVVGNEDTITTPDEADAMAMAIPGARLVVVPDCGHLVPMENPTVFSQKLGTFWRGPG